MLFCIFVIILVSVHALTKRRQNYFNGAIYNEDFLYFYKILFLLAIKPFTRFSCVVYLKIVN